MLFIYHPQDFSQKFGRCVVDNDFVSTKGDYLIWHCKGPSLSALYSVRSFSSLVFSCSEFSPVFLSLNVFFRYIFRYFLRHFQMYFSDVFSDVFFRYERIVRLFGSTVSGMVSTCVFKVQGHEHDSCLIIQILILKMLHCSSKRLNHQARLDRFEQRNVY